ncbi:MAG TPA: choice-of-anchor P family protein [Gemmatimonadales bacterium]|nr:choice-of-anchor P family protein [Gemmatimonadales bacterium]
MNRITKILGVGLLLAAVPLAAQKNMVRTVTGSSVGVMVKSGGSTQQFAVAALPAGGGQASDDASGVTLTQASTASTAAVTAGEADSDGLGSQQSVGTASTVNLMNGMITADRVVGIASVTSNGNKTAGDYDGSVITNLMVNGTLVSGGDYTPAANTRMNIPGGYVVLNEQTTNGRGKGMSVSVNMIHVYLTTGDEIVVGSASSSIQ